MPTPKVSFVYDDLALSALGASVFSATEADASYPAVNAVYPDRTRRWRTTAAPAGTINLIVDLGAAKAVTGFGVCNLQSESGTGAKPAVALHTDNADSSSFSAPTTQASQVAAFWDSGRDWVDTIATVTKRYWRLQFTGVGARFFMGKLILGTGTDIGYFYHAGSEFTWEQPNERQRDVDKRPVDNPFGEPRRMYKWVYRANDPTMRAVFERVAQQTQPFGVQDPIGYHNHVVLAQPAATRFSHVFGAAGNDIWDAEIAMEQMA